MVLDALDVLDEVLVVLEVVDEVVELSPEVVDEVVELSPEVVDEVVEPSPEVVDESAELESAPESVSPPPQPDKHRKEKRKNAGNNRLIGTVIGYSPFESQLTTVSPNMRLVIFHVNWKDYLFLRSN